MSSNLHNPFADCGASDAEQTLRQIANLPAPEGLEDRIHAALRSVPPRGRVLAWPAQGLLHRDWMRAAAAAAIAFVVAGGGWGVYLRVQPGQPGKTFVLPQAAAPGGFSGAGAIRTPQTLSGPVLTHPTQQPKTSKKTATHKGAQPAPASKAAAQPATPSSH